MKPYLKIISYGGLDGDIVQDIYNRVRASKYQWIVDWKKANASVHVCRCLAAEDFLHSEANVLVMCDRDMRFGWNDLDHIAELAAEKEGVVGVCYSKRHFHEGLIWAIHDGQWHEIGSDEVFEVKDGFIGTGLIAIHRQVFSDIHRVCRDAVRIVTGYRGFFLPRVQETMWQDQKIFIHQEDDYAFCARTREAGRKIWVTMRPIVGHMGELIFTPIDTQLRGVAPTKREEI